jgi:hypothetical protein
MKRRALGLLGSTLLLHCATPAPVPRALPAPEVVKPAPRGVFLVNEGDRFTSLIAVAKDGDLLVGVRYEDTPKVLDPKAPAAQQHTEPVDGRLALIRLSAEGKVRWVRPVTFPESKRPGETNLFFERLADDGPGGVWALVLVGDRSALVHLGPDGESLGTLSAVGRYSQMHQLTFDGDGLYLAGHYSGAFQLGDGPALPAAGLTKDGGQRFFGFVARVRRSDLHVEWARSLEGDRIERVLRAELTSAHGLSLLLNDHAPADVIRLPGQAPLRLGDGTGVGSSSAAFRVTFDVKGEAGPLQALPALLPGHSRQWVARDEQGTDVWWASHCDGAKPVPRCTAADEWVDDEGRLLASHEPALSALGDLASLQPAEQGLLLLRDYDDQRELRVRPIHAARGPGAPTFMGRAVRFAGGWAVTADVHEGWGKTFLEESGLMLLPADWQGVLELDRRAW